MRSVGVQELVLDQTRKGVHFLRKLRSGSAATWQRSTSSPVPEDPFVCVVKGDSGCTLLQLKRGGSNAGYPKKDLGGAEEKKMETKGEEREEERVELSQLGELAISARVVSFIYFDLSRPNHSLYLSEPQGKRGEKNKMCCLSNDCLGIGRVDGRDRPSNSKVTHLFIFSIDRWLVSPSRSSLPGLSTLTPSRHRSSNAKAESIVLRVQSPVFPSLPSLVLLRCISCRSLYQCVYVQEPGTLPSQHSAPTPHSLSALGLRRTSNNNNKNEDFGPLPPPSLPHAEVNKGGVSARSRLLAYYGARQSTTSALSAVVGRPTKREREQSEWGAFEILSKTGHAYMPRYKYGWFGAA
eukprot:gene8579-6019_t